MKYDSSTEKAQKHSAYNKVEVEGQNSVEEEEKPDKEEQKGDRRNQPWLLELWLIRG